MADDGASGTSESVAVILADGRTVSGRPGDSLREVLQGQGIALAGLCGGRGRCTTCRVRVDPPTAVVPAGEAERLVLTRVAAGGDVRLGCQARLRHGPVTVTPLLPVGRVPETVTGQECRLAVLMVDLRHSTRLAEGRLPFDVLYILNRFLAEMAEAVAETGGRPSQFSGDGFIALYGLDSPQRTAARQALIGAGAMARRLKALNRELAPDLDRPLKVSLGLHGGTVIAGMLGPPGGEVFTAIGDSVNIAARLESLTRDLGCTMLVSVSTLVMAGIDPAPFRRHRVTLRGRINPLTVCPIDDPALLAAGIKVDAPQPAVGGHAEGR